MWIFPELRGPGGRPDIETWKSVGIAGSLPDSGKAVLKSVRGFDVEGGLGDKKKAGT